MTKLDLVRGIILAEEGNLNDKELVEFVSDHIVADRRSKLYKDLKSPSYDWSGKI